jgi:DNA-binding transcriptional ArsR family regulator
VNSRDSFRQLETLGQPTRFGIARLLANDGEDAGMTVTQIAQALVIPQNSCSMHLAALVDAGILWRRREGRFMRYGIERGAIERLIEYLEQAFGPPGWR